MPAPKKNTFWRARSSHGRKPLFDDPVVLLSACEEYFDWVESNPLYEVKGFAFQGKVTKEKFPKMRAMTIGGMCIFLNISLQTWLNYRNKEDFFDVITQAEEIIKNQKFCGAAAELLNPNIIARDLGLRDNVNNELSGVDGGPIKSEVKNEYQITFIGTDGNEIIKAANTPLPPDKED